MGCEYMVRCMGGGVACAETKIHPVGSTHYLELRGLTFSPRAACFQAPLGSRMLPAACQASCCRILSCHILPALRMLAPRPWPWQLRHQHSLGQPPSVHVVAVAQSQQALLPQEFSHCALATALQHHFVLAPTTFSGDKICPEEIGTNLLGDALARAQFALVQLPVQAVADGYPSVAACRRERLFQHLVDEDVEQRVAGRAAPCCTLHRTLKLRERRPPSNRSWCRRTACAAAALPPLRSRRMCQRP